MSHSSSLWPLLPLPRNPFASYEDHSFTAISLELDLKPSRCQQYCKTPPLKNTAHFSKLLVMLAGDDRKCYPVCLDGCALGAIKSCGVLWCSLSLIVDCWQGSSNLELQRVSSITVKSSWSFGGPLAKALDPAIVILSNKVEFFQRRSYYDPPHYLIFMLLLPSLFLVHHPLTSLAQRRSSCACSPLHQGPGQPHFI